MAIQILEDSFAALAKSHGEFHSPIFDGIVDQNRFLKSSPRILWILKEPWEKLQSGERGGDWSLTSLLLNGEFTNNKGTYPPMAYVSFSVANGFMKCSEIPYLSEDPAVRDALRTLAYINVKKFPGTTISSGWDIYTYYERYKEFLHDQIEAIAPQVIIYGGTFHLFRERLRLDNFASLSGGPEYVTKGGILHISAYHPNQRTISTERYVDGIIETIRREQKGGTPTPFAPVTGAGSPGG